MEQALCEPFELTESELDAVAGGGSFADSLISGSSFAIGAVLGDFSTASGIFAGVVNIFNIDIHPTTSVVANTSVSVSIGIRV